MKFSKFNLFLAIFLMIGTVSAQKAWEKPFQKWSREDAIKIWNSSPWVQTYQNTEAMAALESQNNNQSQNNMRISATQQKISGSGSSAVAIPTVQIRLHSALVVRQALVRMKQIDAGYDKFDDKKRAQFDAAMKNILECPLCKNYYVVTLAKAVDASGQSVEEGIFQTMKSDQLKGNVWLVNEKGDKLQLTEFVPPQAANDLAVFYFKRQLEEGKDFITPDSKSFKFVFNNEFLGGNNPYAKYIPRNFEFKVSNLKVGDELIF